MRGRLRALAASALLSAVAATVCEIGAEDQLFFANFNVVNGVPTAPVENTDKIYSYSVDANQIHTLVFRPPDCAAYPCPYRINTWEVRAHYSARCTILLRAVGHGTLSAICAVFRSETPRQSSEPQGRIGRGC